MAASEIDAVYLTLSEPNPHNGQKHSNNLSVDADELLECVRSFYEVGA